MPGAKVDLYDALGLADVKIPPPESATYENAYCQMWDWSGHEAQMSPQAATASSETVAALYSPESGSGSLVLPDVLPASGALSMCEADAYPWGAIPPLPFGSPDAVASQLPYSYSDAAGYPDAASMYSYPWAGMSELCPGLEYYACDGLAPVAQETGDPLASSSYPADGVNISDGAAPVSAADVTDPDCAPATPPRKLSSLGDAVKVTPSSAVSTVAPMPSPTFTVDEDMAPSKVALPPVPPPGLPLQVAPGVASSVGSAFAPMAPPAFVDDEDVDSSKVVPHLSAPPGLPPMVLNLSEALGVPGHEQTELKTDPVELPRRALSLETATAPTAGEMILQLIKGKAEASNPDDAAPGAAAQTQQQQEGDVTPSTAVSDCDREAEGEAPAPVASKQQRRRRRGGSEFNDKRVQDKAERRPLAAAPVAPTPEVRLGRRAKNGERRAPLPRAEERY